MRKVEFSPGEYYHVYNHGIDEKKVFPGGEYFKRGLVSLVTFNDQKDSVANLSRFVENPSQIVDEYSPDNRDRIVDIIAFTFLPTHYHFFIRERAQDGISRFMHRFSKGYSRFYNLKHERNGPLWKGTFKAKHIDSEQYFNHIVSYIHLNILDLSMPHWREGEIEDWDKASLKLSSYLWSSYQYYRTGTSPLPYAPLILTKPEWFSDYYPTKEDFEKTLRNWSSRFSQNALLGNEDGVIARIYESKRQAEKGEIKKLNSFEDLD